MTFCHYINCFIRSKYESFIVTLLVNLPSMALIPIINAIDNSHRWH